MILQPEDPMERRQFLTSSLAATAVAAVGSAPVQAPAQATVPEREFYLIRRYNLMSGPQLKLTENFLAGALIPTLERLGFGPIGAFRVDIGPETPTYYVLIPGSSPDRLATLNFQLAADAQFLQAADPYWNAKSTARPFQLIEDTLLAAFTGWPKVTPPPSSATKGKRMFQLRCYESPSNGDHIRKVEMFHSGEFDYFQAAGCHPVFFGDTLIGSRMPNLMYMLSFPDMAALETSWDAFRNNPGWKKLQADPRFAFDQIVSNITNLMLSPLDCSQI
jgi:hypothetical protein